MTNLGTLATGDELYCVDDPGGTPLSRACTVDVLQTYILQGEAATAAALAANGGNCLAGEIPLGVDAAGAVEGCYEPTEADITDLTHFTTGDEINNLSAAVTWANVPDANVSGANERDEVCGTTDLSATCLINSNVINQDELASSITFAASDNIVLPIEAADQTTDGEIDFDSTEEVIEVGDDGVATLKFYPGTHFTTGDEINDLSAAVTWANVPDANVDGGNERDEVLVAAAGGTNLTCAAGVCNVDDAFLLLAGDSSSVLIP